MKRNGKKAPKGEPAPMGRPPEPVPADTADRLFDWLAEGGSVLAFARIEGNPSKSTIYRWCAKDEAFAGRFTRAREAGADALVDEAVDVARTPQVGEIRTEESIELERKGEDGQKVKVPATKVTVRREDMLGHRRLLAETLIKVAACYNPKRFGSKVALGGDVGAPPIQVANTGPELPRGDKLRDYMSTFLGILKERGDVPSGTPG